MVDISTDVTAEQMRELVDHVYNSRRDAAERARVRAQWEKEDELMRLGFTFLNPTPRHRNVWDAMDLAGLENIRDYGVNVQHYRQNSKSWIAGMSQMLMGNSGYPLVYPNPSDPEQVIIDSNSKFAIQVPCGVIKFTPPPVPFFHDKKASRMHYDHLSFNSRSDRDQAYHYLNRTGVVARLL